ncbi:MAG TPA: YetF domain-containing protein [Solirubrobacteraceae bacterium]
MDLVFRTTYVFFLILLLTRAVGRRELSSMEPFDLILLVVIGDLVQQGVTQSDYSLTGATTVIVTLSLLTVATAYATFRIRRLRPILEGDPIVLVVDGEPIERNLRRERMTLDELAAAARLKDVGSLDEIRFAVLESNGQVSFIKRD